MVIGTRVSTVGSKKLEPGYRVICAGVPSFFAVGSGERSCSNFPASAAGFVTCPHLSRGENSSNQMSLGPFCRNVQDYHAGASRGLRRNSRELQ